MITRPDSIPMALDDIQTCMLGISEMIDECLEHPNNKNLQLIKDSCLNTHLMVTWIKDNYKELHK